MASMNPIDPKEKQPAPELVTLFEGHRTLRAVIDAVLDGHLGRVVVDEAGNPEAARLDIGCYAIFGGDPGAPGAVGLVREAETVSPIRPFELIGPDDQGWRDLFFNVYSERLGERPMRTFSSHAFDREHLRRLVEEVPPGFEVRDLNIGLASQLGADLEPHGLQTYPSPEAFVEEGLGAGVVYEGRLVSAATSYARSSGRIEVAISTHPEFRKKGLARAAGAGLLGRALDAGLVPDWSAANPVSKRLALSLGYLPGPLCDVFVLA